MEQRIDSNTKPEFAAGTDPAYIPGLTAPAPARTEAEAEKAEPEEIRDAEPAEAPSEGVADEAVDDATAAADATPGADVEPEGAETAGAGGKAGGEDGPVFEVSDRRGSIRLDAEGVRFRLDDQEAEFDWSEIGAVEVRTGRFGRRFTVTVHLSSRRWFNAEVEAGSRSDLKTWTAEFDEALDAYFEEA
ncbi:MULTISPECIES: hypothetical protein [Streptomyces]|uniref:hypothetical protein n=1 Tax=Streptomyces TaxID=1883 RepID=UPI0026DFEA9E|nr:hypothetical protein [Streptomyces sp. SNU607]WKV77434.1 hypothetical protein HBB06_04425 [Streptomyces sp. SNU607]